MERGPLSISITSGTVLTFFGVAISLWLIVYLKELVLVIVTAIVLASAVEPGVLWFMKRGFHRVAAVASIYLLVFGFIFGIAYALFPPLVAETADLSKSLPHYLEALNIDDILNNTLVDTARTVVGSVPTFDQYLSQLQSVFTSTSVGAFKALAGIFGGVLSFALIIVLSIYFAIEETGVDDFLRIVVPAEHTAYAVDLWKRSQVKIGLWMQGQLVLSLLAGVFVYLCLALLGVPYAFVLAVFATVTELIPVFGSFIAAAPAIGIAFNAGGAGMALAVAACFIIINQLQSNLVYPLVVKHVVGVPPLLVIIALIAGGQLAGFLGVLLSVPLAAALSELVGDIQKSKERTLSRLNSREA